MNVYFYTLGCKVNQYETEAMMELFRSAGYAVVNGPHDADVIIVNSCTVTANSDQKTRQAVRRFKRGNRNAIVVLTGCMPQAAPEKACELLEADIITGNTDHQKLLKLVEQKIKIRKSSESVESLEDDSPIWAIDPHENKEEFEELSITHFEGRTRAFIKIQDGCNRYCSYCIIPTSRGRSRSRSLESIGRELDKIRANGYKEIVLVGINFCCYGLDIGKDFVDAIELACSKGFDRVRIGSLEYDNISDEAIARLSKLPNFCPQFHMSLQSGSDETLKRMHRHYTTEEYETLCNKLRAAFKDTTITTDIIAGFPMETEEEFEESIAFARKIGFEKIHAFPYSIRPGTRAAEMKPQVPGNIKSERNHRMIKVAEEIRQSFFEKQIGKQVKILCEQYDKDLGLESGYTENYTPVYFKSPSSLEGEIVDVKITGIDMKKDSCVGELI